MDRVHLLSAIKARQTEALKDILLPTVAQKGIPSVERPAEIFTGRLPDRKSETTKAPYILNAILNSNFFQRPGEQPDNDVTVRTVVCVHHENGELGAAGLLNLLERMRISYTAYPILDDMYEVDFEKGIQDLIYPDDTAPFYMAEQITVWKLPPVKREGWRKWLDDPKPNPRI